MRGREGGCRGRCEYIPVRSASAIPGLGRPAIPLPGPSPRAELVQGAFTGNPAFRQPMKPSA